MIACVTVFFNPVGYSRILKNYFEFREKFSKRIDLFCVEASFSGNYETDAEFKIRANPSNQWMWQKERLINWAVDHLPDKYDRYMYSDCDLLYPDGWETHAIESNGITQCFGDIEFLGPDRQIISANPSVMRWQIEKVGEYGSPGGAWIYPREVRQYDRAPLGAGDSLLERALTRKEDTWPKKIMSSKEYDFYLRWSNFPSFPISYIPVTIQHLYHGSRENRKYVQRHEVLKANDYDPEMDVQIAKNGLLTWCSYKPKMHQAVKEYFSGRKEDD